jgi:hypothetical protein
MSIAVIVPNIMRGKLVIPLPFASIWVQS